MDVRLTGVVLAGAMALVGPALADTSTTSERTRFLPRPEDATAWALGDPRFLETADGVTAAGSTAEELSIRLGGLTLKDPYTGRLAMPLSGLAGWRLEVLEGPVPGAMGLGPGLRLGPPPAGKGNLDARLGAAALDAPARTFFDTPTLIGISGGTHLNLELAAGLSTSLWDNRATALIWLMPVHRARRWRRELTPRLEGGEFMETPVETETFEGTELALNHVLALHVFASDRHSVEFVYAGSPLRRAGTLAAPVAGSASVYGGDDRVAFNGAMGAWRARWTPHLDTRLGVGLSRHYAGIVPVSEVQAEAQVRTLFLHQPTAYANLENCATTADGLRPCDVSRWHTGGLGPRRERLATRLEPEAVMHLRFEAAGRHVLELGGRGTLVWGLERRALTGSVLQARFSEEETETLRYGFCCDVGGNLSLQDNADQRVSGQRVTVWLGDRWRLGEDWTVRPELAVVVDALGTAHLTGPERAALVPSLAPGLGAEWRHGPHRVSADLRRLVGEVPLGISLAGSGGLGADLQSFFSGTAVGTGSRLRRTDPSLFPTRQAGVVLPGTGATLVDQAMLGYRLEATARWTLTGSLRARRLARLLETVNGPAGVFVTNPGQPGPSGSMEDEALLAFAESLPRPDRLWFGASVGVHRTFESEGFLSATLLASRSLGNHVGGTDPRFSRGDPGATPAWDGLSITTNAWGPLPDDRPWALVVEGGRPLGAGVTIGGRLRSAAGRPRHVLGATTGWGRRSAFVLPRGSAGHLAPLHAVDLRLGWTHELAQDVELAFDLEATNLLDLQGTVSVMDEWTREPVRPVQGGTLADIQDSSGNPTLRNAATGQVVSRRPGYGRPQSTADLQDPRSVRLGVRIHF